MSDPITTEAPRLAFARMRSVPDRGPVWHTPIVQRPINLPDIGPLPLVDAVRMARAFTQDGAAVMGVQQAASGGYLLTGLGIPGNQGPIPLSWDHPTMGGGYIEAFERPADSTLAAVVGGYHVAIFDGPGDATKLTFADLGITSDA
jgi:hypothetical protein